MRTYWLTQGVVPPPSTAQNSQKGSKSIAQKEKAFEHYTQ